MEKDEKIKRGERDLTYDRKYFHCISILINLAKRVHCTIVNFTVVPHNFQELPSYLPSS